MKKLFRYILYPFAIIIILLYRSCVMVKVNLLHVHYKEPNKADSVVMTYKTKFIWWNPLTWILLIVLGLVSLWESGIKDVLEEMKDSITYPEHDTKLEWVYEVPPSSLRLWWECFINPVVS